MKLPRDEALEHYPELLKEARQSSRKLERSYQNCLRLLTERLAASAALLRAMRDEPKETMNSYKCDHAHSTVAHLVDLGFRIESGMGDHLPAGVFAVLVAPERHSIDEIADATDKTAMAVSQFWHARARSLKV